MGKFAAGKPQLGIVGCDLVDSCLGEGRRIILSAGV